MGAERGHSVLERMLWGTHGCWEGSLRWWEGPGGHPWVLKKVFGLWVLRGVTGSWEGI